MFLRSALPGSHHLRAPRTGSDRHATPEKLEVLGKAFRAFSDARHPDHLRSYVCAPRDRWFSTRFTGSLLRSGVV
jgi:hypothetical protein